MADKRRLQGEIDRTLRKVNEGCDAFDDIWIRIQTASNANQKDKYETELKKEIKKLQRLREQIKNWQSSNEIKDKKPLLDARRSIEQQMEKFKENERELKGKGKNARNQGLDPEQREQEELKEWLGDCVMSLNTQIESYESKLEDLEANNKKKKDKEKIESIKSRIETHKRHVNTLEKLQEMLTENAISIKKVQDIQEDVKDYIENNEGADFEENIYIFDDLELDKFLSTSAKTTNESEEDEDLVSGNGSVNLCGENDVGDNEEVSDNDSSSDSHSACESPPLNDSHHDEPVTSLPQVAPTSSQTQSPNTKTNGSNNSNSNNNNRRRYKSESTNSNTNNSNQDDTTNSFSKLSNSPAATAPTTITTNTSQESTKTSGQTQQQQRGRTNSNVNQKSNNKNNINTFIPVTTTNASNSTTTNTSSQAPVAPTPISTTSAISFSAALTQNKQTQPIVTTIKKVPQQSNVIEPFQPVASQPVVAQQQQPPPPPAPVVSIPTPTPPPSIALTPQTQPQSQQQSAINNVNIKTQISPNNVESMQQFTEMSQQQAEITSQLPNGTITPTIDQEDTVALHSPKSMVDLAYAQVQQQPQQINSTNANILAQLMSMQQQQQPSINQHSLQIDTNRMLLQHHHQQQQQQQQQQATTNNVTNMSPPGLVQQQQQQNNETFIQPILGVAPLGKVTLNKDQFQQLEILDSALKKLPIPADSERSRAYFQRTPVHTPNYYPSVPPPNHDSLDFLCRLSNETLFFMFYYMEGTKAQFLAAQALKKLSWRFHTRYMMWFQRLEEPQVITDDFEQGTYIYFDFEKWAQRKKEGFTFEYKYLEDRDLSSY